MLRDLVSKSSGTLFLIEFQPEVHHLPPEGVVFKGIVVKGAAESLRGLDRFEETLAPLLLALPLAPLQQVVAPWCQLTHHLLDGVIVVVDDVLEARVVPLRDVVSIVEDQLEEEFELTNQGLG